MTSRTHLLFLDDSVQKEPRRGGMKELVAIGGVVVPADIARELHDRINEECKTRFGLPDGAAFKWSAKKDSWFRENLGHEDRNDLRKMVLSVAKDYDLSGIVTICDTDTPPLERQLKHEMGALISTLERFELTIGSKDTGIVIIDRPAGGKKDEEGYLSTCAEIVETGSRFAQFNKLACPIVSMPFKLSRILQIADLVTSITTAHFAGIPGAADLFPYVLPLLKVAQGRRGGVSVKLHPAKKYQNLYHWLLDDSHFVRGSSGIPMPLSDHPYAGSPDSY